MQGILTLRSIIELVYVNVIPSHASEGCLIFIKKMLSGIKKRAGVQQSVGDNILVCVFIYADAP